MKRYDVTIIVCTYNPMLFKLVSTLKSCIFQKDVSFEIIVTDDGSIENYKLDVEELFKEYSFHNYIFLDNTENCGTVKNIINGIDKAKGEYTYVISPGDYFYEETTIAKLYRFAKKRNADICFGKSQFYYKNDGKVELIHDMAPSSPLFYSLKNIRQSTKALAYCTSQCIVGASFFRKTDVFKSYLFLVKDFSVYDEDNTTTYIHMLLNKKNVYFFNEYVVWYEYGVGISTSQNNEFQKKLKDDCNRVLKYILANGGNKRIIEYIMQGETKSGDIGITLKVYFIRMLCKLMRNKSFLKNTTDFFQQVDSKCMRENGLTTTE